MDYQYVVRPREHITVPTTPPAIKKGGEVLTAEEAGLVVGTPMERHLTRFPAGAHDPEPEKPKDAAPSGPATLSSPAPSAKPPVATLNTEAAS